MNKVILMGRLARDPDVRYTQGENAMAIANYTLAVDRMKKKDGSEQQADFISCKAFGKAGEFAEKYLHKGTKICVSGRIQTGSYTNKEGVKVYTTDVVVDEQDFAESKNSNATAPAGNTQQQTAPKQAAPDEGFMDIPEGADEEIPFN